MKDDKESRLRGESKHNISQHEIDAWTRGKADAFKSTLLKKSLTVPPINVIKFVKNFSQFGDIHRASTKLGVSLQDANKILSMFNIQSVEDARQVVDYGIIKEYEDAVIKHLESSRAADIMNLGDAEQRLEAHEQKINPQQKDQEEINHILPQRQREAMEKNKKDKIRQLISEGINPNTNRSDFRINVGDVTAFKSMIPHGVSMLQRHFGGTKQDIVAEIKRLAPHYNIDLLRP